MCNGLKSQRLRQSARLMHAHKQPIADPTILSEDSSNPVAVASSRVTGLQEREAFSQNVRLLARPWHLAEGRSSKRESKSRKLGVRLKSAGIEPTTGRYPPSIWRRPLYH
eukprot:1155248-Pelagomonas_calceolata.AAC.3